MAEYNKIFVSKKCGDSFNAYLRLALDSGFQREKEKGKTEAALFNQASLKYFYGAAEELFNEIKTLDDKMKASPELLEEFFETVRYLTKEAVEVRSNRKAFSKEREEWFSNFFESLYGTLKEENGKFFLKEMPIYEKDGDGLVFYRYNQLVDEYKIVDDYDVTKNENTGSIPEKE